MDEHPEHGLQPLLRPDEARLLQRARGIQLQDVALDLRRGVEPFPLLRELGCEAT